uniref:Uncharacterized protein AlNc14C131G6951 n=1 Tax=Albugo laibachii Nc14 TaxID=890382 RepID=F0WK98_9STRA|nr:conserved hypothetical protein [Albugo laibachii Nc14]CCA21875.1 conserved hypothetical protein [Albugo laibachii Nc14]|eukprot:CCA21875.1 conserved hypothetical protein [Albugo laibachii Nc14]
MEQMSGMNLNANPSFYQAGISSKFTKRHVTNFQDSSLNAASAAKERAKLSIIRRSEAIQNQQKKIDTEIRKIEELSQQIQRKKERESKRIFNHWSYSATRIQNAYRNHCIHLRMLEHDAAVRLQGAWRGQVARSVCRVIRIQREKERVSLVNEACRKVIRAKYIRQIELQEIYLMTRTATILQCFVRRKIAEQFFFQLKRQASQSKLEYTASVKIQACVRAFIARKIYLDILYYICRMQAYARGYLVRNRIKLLYSQYLQNDAATHIQRMLREYLRRRERCRMAQTAVQIGARVPRRHAKADVSPQSRPTQLPIQAVQRRDRLRMKHDKHVNSKQRNKKYKPAPINIAEASDRAVWVPPGSSLPSAVQVESRKGSIEIREECNEVDIKKAQEIASRHQRGSLIRQAMMARKHEEKRRFEALHKQQQATEILNAERSLMDKEDKRIRLIAKSVRRHKLNLIQKKRQAALEEEQRERQLMSKEERLVRLYHQGIARALATAQRALLSAKLEQQGIAESPNHNHKTCGKDVQVRAFNSCDDSKQKKNARGHAVKGHVAED